MLTALFLLHNAGALHAQTNPCRDTVVRIANCGIVLVPANITNVLCHTNKN